MKSLSCCDGNAGARMWTLAGAQDELPDPAKRVQRGRGQLGASDLQDRISSYHSHGERSLSHLQEKVKWTSSLHEVTAAVLCSQDRDH